MASGQRLERPRRAGAKNTGSSPAPRRLVVSFLSWRVMSALRTRCE